MGRYWLLILPGIGILVLGAIAGWFVFFQDPICQESLDKIDQSTWMTEDEVEAILGSPTETMDVRPSRQIRWFVDGKHRLLSTKAWKGASMTIIVDFIAESPESPDAWTPPEALPERGIVFYAGKADIKETFVDKVRRWLAFNSSSPPPPPPPCAPCCSPSTE